MSIQMRPERLAADVSPGVIEDAYAECERFDSDIERTESDIFACRHDLLRAARTPRMRALADRLVKAEEEAADVRNLGFFMAGVRAGIRIARGALGGRRYTKV